MQLLSFASLLLDGGAVAVGGVVADVGAGKGSKHMVVVAFMLLCVEEVGTVVAVVALLEEDM